MGLILSDSEERGFLSWVGLDCVFGSVPIFGRGGADSVRFWGSVGGCVSVPGVSFPVFGQEWGWICLISGSGGGSVRSGDGYPRFRTGWGVFCLISGSGGGCENVPNSSEDVLNTFENAPEKAPAYTLQTPRHTVF